LLIVELCGLLSKKLSKCILYVSCAKANPFTCDPRGCLIYHDEKHHFIAAAPRAPTDYSKPIFGALIGPQCLFSRATHFHPRYHQLNFCVHFSPAKCACFSSSPWIYSRAAAGAVGWFGRIQPVYFWWAEIDDETAL
jgi:hypothetical protein